MAEADGASFPARLGHSSVLALGVSGATISLLGVGQYGFTMCVTDEEAARLEAIQMTLGEGPGVNAHRSGRAVVVEPDLAGAAQDRWASLH